MWLYASKKSLTSSGAVKLLNGKANGNLSNRYATILPALGKDKIGRVGDHSLKQEESPLFIEGSYKKSRQVSAESSLIQDEPKEMEKLGTSEPEKNKGVSATSRKIGSQIGQSTKALSKKLSEFFIPRSKL